ncbi:hypothetical protein [uncultured Ruminococcus sp.]|uniref:hypothetical protein n=1 Tax=uncultured Ruminococcus sp. TaxID=165186 RepID=UPI0025F1EEAC|nr:hypothetical protein [uncultured Ruminococcus sp.]
MLKIPSMRAVVAMRRHAQTKMPERTGFLYTALIYSKGVVHFSRLVVLLWCLSTGETKTPWKKRSAVPDDFQHSSKHMDKGSIPVNGFCGYFKENPPHDRFYFTHKHTTYFCINAPLKPNDHYLKRRCMKKKKQAESERGDFH